MHDVLSRVRNEEEAVVAEASAEHALPLLAPQGLYVPLKGITLHLAKHAGNALLDALWKVAEVPLCVVGEVTNPVHL